MSSSYEKSVKGGTKIKLAAPKSKYVEHILQATRAGDAGVAEIFRTMQNRLRDSTWTIVFKALIITHLMIREGEANKTLRYLSENPTKLAISNFSDVQVQGENIRHYYDYLIQRVEAYHDTHIDWVRDGKDRLKRQTIDKGLLRQTEAVQNQIRALLKCELFSAETENEITLTAFRLLTMDLLSLYHVGNEGAINLLEHYFEMSKPDAERALEIYKTFSKQTDRVVGFLNVARQHKNATRLEIPKLKHAPTGLTSSLEEYLNDPDFEINRRQYLAQKEAKKSGKASSSTKDPSPELSKLDINGTSAKSGRVPNPSQAQAPQVEPRGPAPDLIDFFESIGQNQQSMGSQPQPHFANDRTIPQYQFQQQPFQSPQGQELQSQGQSFSGTNPFANMMVPQQQQQQQQQHSQVPVQTGFTDFAGQSQIQSQQFSPNQNFAQSQASSFQQQPFVTGESQPFTLRPQQQLQQQQQPPFINGSQPFPQDQPQSYSSPMTSGILQPNATGSTNPFRQSMMPQPTTSGSQSFTSPSPISPSQSSQSTNPFRSFSPQAAQNGAVSPFPTSAPPSSASSFFSMQSLQSPQSVQSMPAAQPLQPARTGTNPFKSAPPSAFSSSATASPLKPQRTGTNPFRQSAFVNQQTGQGWQASQGTMGGLENLDTIPVFPRPAGQ